MTRTPCYFAAIAAAAFCLLVPPASATHVQCGDTITTYTVLDSDVQCAANEPYGLIIGASDVTLGLNGFTVRGGGEVGILSPANPLPFERVIVKRGTIEGFVKGVSLQASDSTVYKVNVPVVPDASAVRGIELIGNRNTVLQSSVDTGPHGGGFGIVVQGDDSYLWGNVVTGLSSPIGTVGERNRIVYNQADCQCIGGSPWGGIQASYDGTVLVNRNTVRHYVAGGVIVSKTDSAAPGGARVTLNETFVPAGGGSGLDINDERAVVGRNVSRGNPTQGGGTGITSNRPGTTLRSNAMFDHGFYGIYAVEGTIDGGGNVASGNGDGVRPQCVNVECGTP